VTTMTFPSSDLPAIELGFLFLRMGGLQSGMRNAPNQALLTVFRRATQCSRSIENYLCTTNI
jgi:hypothetical protein